MIAPIHPLPNSTAEVCADCARVNKCQPCFEELVRRFQSPLLHFLLRKTRSRQEAEDLLQETFLTAYRSLDQYQSTWKFTTWIFTIAHRVAISHHRKKHLFTVNLNQTVGEIRPTNPHTLADQNETRSKLWDAAQQILEPDSFTALWLSYAETMPADQIGRVLNRNANAVRILLHRARQKLGKQLEPSWDITGAQS